MRADIALARELEADLDDFVERTLYTGNSDLKPSEQDSLKRGLLKMTSPAGSMAFLHRLAEGEDRGVCDCLRNSAGIFFNNAAPPFSRRGATLL